MRRSLLVVAASPLVALLAAAASGQESTRKPALDRGQLEPVVAALGRLLVHPEEQVREAASDGLMNLGRAVELAFPAILDAVKAGEGPRETARSMIAQLGPRAADLVPGLVAYGRSGEPSARPIVVLLLLDLAPWVRGAEGFLEETVASKAGPVREQAAVALLIADPTRTAARDLLSARVLDGTIERDPRLAEAIGRAGVNLELSIWVVRALDDEQLENKSFAEALLERIDGRSSAAVPALVNALLSDVEHVRTTAAESLGRIGPGATAASDALARLLGSTEAGDRRAAARALVRIQPAHVGTIARVVEAYRSRPEGREEQTVLEELAETLCEAEPGVAARGLSESFDRGDGAIKLRLLELADATIGWEEKERGASATSLPETRAKIHRSALAAAAAALIRRAEKSTEPELRHRAVRSVLDRSTDAAQAELALAVLAELPPDGDPADVKPFVDALSSVVWRNREALAPKDESSPARFSADELVDVLLSGRLHDCALRDAEVAALLDAAGGRDETRARLAATALGSYDGPISAATTARLAEALKSGADYVQAAAADLLDGDRAADGAADGAAAVPALIAALGDASRARRLEAIRTLGRLGVESRAAVPRLIQLLSDGDPEISLAALEAFRSALAFR